MGALDVFALIILIVLLVAIVAGAVALGMAPGRIARARDHPQADAVNVCGWCGILTMGILLPLAYIWAYYKPAYGARKEVGESAAPAPEDREPAA